MPDDLVLRSALLTKEDDAVLRKLAADLGVPKQELLQAALTIQLDSWMRTPDKTSILKDLEITLAGKESAMKFHPDDEASKQTDDTDNVVSQLATALAVTFIVIGVGIATYMTGFFFGERIMSKRSELFGILLLAAIVLAGAAGYQSFKSAAPDIDYTGVTPE